MEDRDAAGNAPVRVKGVFKLSVTGHDGTENKAIDVGDKVYYTAPSGGTPAIIDANATTGKEFGVALKAIAAGCDRCGRRDDSRRPQRRNLNDDG